ncbi:MAG: hypothetical protein QF489_10135 [Planctomycetota bacterium]|jgi:hypothetical protein|nr:hypothetical protein [Planctomycetota bacterium]
MLEKHLEACAVCQVEYESYASARDALQALKGEPMGTTNLWGDLEAQLDAVTSEPVDRKHWFHRPVWVGLAAAMALVVTVQLWNPFRPANDVVREATNSVVSGIVQPQKTLGLPEESEGPQSAPAAYDDFHELLRGRHDQSSLEDLNDPMIAAPASRRSF